jgi:hypothetical protein
MTYARNTRTTRAVDPAVVGLTVLGAAGAPVTSAVWAGSPTGALLLVIFAVTAVELVVRALTSRAEDYPLTVGRVVGGLFGAVFSAFGYVVMWLGLTAFLAVLAVQSSDAGDLSPAAAFGTAFGYLVPVSALVLFVFGVLSLVGSGFRAHQEPVTAGSVAVAASGPVQRAASAVEEAETRPDVTAEDALVWLGDSEEVRRLAGQILLSVAPPAPIRPRRPAQSAAERPVPIDCPRCGRPTFTAGGVIASHSAPGTAEPCRQPRVRR